VGLDAGKGKCDINLSSGLNSGLFELAA